MNITSSNNIGFNGIYTACINNKLGLHMMPSGTITKLTKLSEKPIIFSTNTCAPRNVRGSIMGILTMEPAHGKEIKVEVPDDYPKNILDAVLGCINAHDDKEVKAIFEAFNKATGNNINVLA